MEDAQPIRLANGQAEAIEVDCRALRTVDATQIDALDAINEDPDIVVATEIEVLGAIMCELRVHFSREEKVLIVDCAHALVPAQPVDWPEGGIAETVDL